MMFDIEKYLSKILEEYRTIEEVQKRINTIAKEAEEIYKSLNEEDKEFEKGYIDCVRSYTT